MKKNSGIKLLSAVVVGVVALILINRGNHEALPGEHQNDPNNMNAAIASQFNDNIRDVSARLLETQEKVLAIEKQNKTLRAQNAALHQGTLNSVIPSEITSAIEQLKQEFSELKGAREVSLIKPITRLMNSRLIHAIIMYTISMPCS